MVTVRDGIKIGFGLLLFKWLLGLGSCAVTVSLVTCLYFGSEEGKKELRETFVPQSRGKEELQETRQSRGLTYHKRCIVRDAPKGKKIGFARAKVKYQLAGGRSGNWWAIQFKGRTGWVGCSRPNISE